MKKRIFVIQIILSIIILTFTLFSCSGKNGTITIDVSPDYFKTNYVGLGNGDNYFTYNLDSEPIYLRPNSLKKLYITPDRRYDGLDSLRIKKTKTMMGSNPVYSIEEIVKEK